jgi:hemerythrin
MRHYEWTDKISTGIKELDEQHKHFIELFNFCIDNCENKNFDVCKAKKHMMEIICYARKHFSTEERIFEKYNYSHSKEHAIEHIKLLATLLSKYDQFDGSKEAGLDFLEFIDKWVNEHLAKEDMKYAKYLKTIKLDAKDACL